MNQRIQCYRHEVLSSAVKVKVNLPTYLPTCVLACLLACSYYMEMKLNLHEHAEIICSRFWFWALVSHSLFDCVSPLVSVWLPSCVFGGCVPPLGFVLFCLFVSACISCFACLLLFPFICSLAWAALSASLGLRFPLHPFMWLRDFSYGDWVGFCRRCLHYSPFVSFHFAAVFFFFCLCFLFVFLCFAALLAEL